GWWGAAAWFWSEDPLDVLDIKPGSSPTNDSRRVTVPARLACNIPLPFARSVRGSAMATSNAERLLRRVATRDELLEFRRRRVVGVRFDPRLATRVDPSDVSRKHCPRPPLSCDRDRTTRYCSTADCTPLAPDVVCSFSRHFCVCARDGNSRYFGVV